MVENKQNEYVLRWKYDNVIFTDKLTNDSYPSSSDYFLESKICLILEKYLKTNNKHINEKDKVDILYLSFLQKKNTGSKVLF